MQTPPFPYRIEIARIELEEEPLSVGFIIATDPIGIALTPQEIINALSEFFMHEAMQQSKRDRNTNLN